jgi:vacuolar-type H+-ATPase subunit C/Vma6
MDEQSLQELKKLRNIQEIIDFIRPYYPDLNVSKFTIGEIEKALYHIYIKLIGKIMLFSPISMRNFLKFYLLKYEIMNIKQLIIGSIVGLSKKEKSKNINFLVEEYLDNTDFIKKLSELSDLSEIQLLMRRTKYNKAIREGILYFRNNNEIFVLEAFLDRLYYENLLKQKRIYNKKERTIIYSFINLIIEIYNLKTIYRGIKNNIEPKILIQFVVHNYQFFNQQVIKKLVNLKDVEVFFDKVEDYLKNVEEIKDLSKRISFKREHFIWSLEGIYQNYFFNKLKIKADDIEYITIFRIIELLIRKDKEIRFDILPLVIRILNAKYEILEFK